MSKDMKIKTFVMDSGRDTPEAFDAEINEWLDINIMKKGGTVCDMQQSTAICPATNVPGYIPSYAVTVVTLTYIN